MMTITRKLRTLAAIAIAAVTVTSTGFAAQAQGTQPNIAALIHSADGKGASARVFEPKASEGRELFKINEGMAAILSPDTTHALMHGTTGEPGTFSASIFKAGAANGMPITVPQNFDFVGGSFSPSNKYLAYSLANLPTGNDEAIQYSFVIFDIAAGKAISTVTANVVYPQGQGGAANPLPASGFYGGPLALFWLDDNRIVITSFLPYSDGGMDGLFVIEASKAQPNAIPPATPLVKQPVPANALKTFSGDNAKVAYTIVDPQRPIKAPDAMFGPFNGITIVDIASSAAVNAAVPGDNVVGNGFTFSGDGTKVYFNAGKYVDPMASGGVQSETRLYTADVATGQVTEGPVLLADKQTTLYQMVACGATLYLSVSKNDPNAPTAQLIAAPVDNPTAQTVVYSGTGYIQLVDCAP
jgi:hypothetical protein